MPPLSRWFLGLSLLYLVLGTLAGATIMLSRATGGFPLFAWLLPLHIEFMLAGWAVQLAMGVAYWILPRHRTEPSRGNIVIAWLAFWAFNLGVLLAGVGGGTNFPWNLAVLGHVSEGIGVVLFAIGIWQRLPRSVAPAGKALPIIG